MYGTSRCSLSSSTVLSGATCAVQFLAYLVVQFAASLVVGTYGGRGAMKQTGARLYGTLCSLSSSTVFSLSSSTMKFVVRTCLASGSQSV